MPQSLHPTTLKEAHDTLTKCGITTDSLKHFSNIAPDLKEVYEARKIAKTRIDHAVAFLLKHHNINTK